MEFFGFLVSEELPTTRRILAETFSSSKESPPIDDIDSTPDVEDEEEDKEEEEEGEGAVGVVDGLHRAFARAFLITLDFDAL